MAESYNGNQVLASAMSLSARVEHMLRIDDGKCLTYMYVRAVFVRNGFQRK